MNLTFFMPNFRAAPNAAMHDLGRAFRHGVTEGLIASGVRLFGMRMITAHDRDEFEDRMDEALRDPAFYEEFQSAVEASVSAEVEADHTQDSAPGLFVMSGDALAHLFLLSPPGDEEAITDVTECFNYLKAIRENFPNLERGQYAKGTQTALKEATDLLIERPLWFLTDPRVSADMGRTALRFYQLIACLYAVAALLRTRRCEAWLSEAIIATMKRSLYDYLRFLASLPDSKVPTSLVPKSDRFEQQPKGAIRYAKEVRAAQAGLARGVRVDCPEDLLD